MDLNTLQELVHDENRVITYKWLSSTQGIHINSAKKLLYEFSLKLRKNNDDNINITYFLSGTSTSTDGTKSIHHKVVSEDQLEEQKALFDCIISCHVYSVQASKLKDTSSLYITDYETLREGVYNYNNHGCISHEALELRSEDYVKPPSEATEDQPSNSSSESVKPPKKDSNTKKSMSAMESMFSKQRAKNAETQKKPEIQNTDKPLKSEKQSPKGKQITSPKKAEVTSKINALFSKKQAEPKSQVKVNKESDKKSKSEGGKKRRRIQVMSESSSDEGEDQENPVPMSPREATPEPVAINEQPTCEDPIPASASTSNNPNTSQSKKRKRVKKLIPKTFMDDDGFMVTEKVWQTESSEASEAEEPVPKASSATDSGKPPSKQIKAKPSPPKKSSPQKSGPKLQKSITSFFTKK